MKVVHVLSGLNRGGVETWLVNCARHLDSKSQDWSFITYGPGPFQLDDDLFKLGIKRYSIGSPTDPVRFASNLWRVLKSEGPFDVVHSHLYDLSGIILSVARAAGVPVRIAHSHSTNFRSGIPYYRRTLFPLSQMLIRRNGTLGVGCSIDSRLSLFGTDNVGKHVPKIIYCGIDTEAFSHAPGDGSLRGELGFEPDDYIVGHVGRFDRAKNQKFALNVARSVVDRNQRVKFLFIGDGPLMSEMKSHTESLGLASHVVYAGTRSDVPAIMCSVMDSFIFPSIYEGLPLTILEAQFAGLPCFVSNSVSREVDLKKGQIRWLSLEQGSKEWADQILAMPERLVGALNVIGDSEFQIERSLLSLIDTYESLLAPSKG